MSTSIQQLGNLTIKYNTCTYSAHNTNFQHTDHLSILTTGKNHLKIENLETIVLITVMSSMTENCQVRQNE